MSLEQHAFLARERVPSATEWQAAVTQLGFDFRIDPELKPFEDSGFLPCKLGQMDAGFEIYYEDAADVLDTYPEIAEKVAPRDCVISFRWGGHMEELASVLIASAALAKSFDAVVYDPEIGEFPTADELISTAREVSADIDEEPEQPASPKPPVIPRPTPTKRWWEFWK